MSKKQEQYLVEYEKYKHIQLGIGNYINKDGIAYEITCIGENTAVVRTSKSGVETQRTLHWCRKYLTKV